MKKMKKKIVSITAMSLVLGSTMVTANASSGIGAKLRVPAGFSIHNQAEKTAIENGDYNAWKAVKETGKDNSADFLTEEKFNIIVRAYKLKKSGDLSGAMTLLQNSQIPKRAIMFGGPGGRTDKWTAPDDARDTALMTAYENKDFDAWTKLMEGRGGGKILELVNADNFSKFAEAKVLQAQGKRAESKAIMDELGFPFRERGVRPHGESMATE